MTALEKFKNFDGCTGTSCMECPFNAEDTTPCVDVITSSIKPAIEELETNAKLQKQYATQLESDNEKLSKIVNILCDTISQLIE